MQLSFDAPVFSSAAQEFLGRPGRGIGAGDDGPGFASRFALVQRAALQFSNLGRRDKADLFRMGGLHAQSAVLFATAIGFPAFRTQGLVWREKKQVLPVNHGPSCGEFLDWF